MEKQPKRADDFHNFLSFKYGITESFNWIVYVPTLSFKWFGILCQLIFVSSIDIISVTIFQDKIY